MSREGRRSAGGVHAPTSRCKSWVPTALCNSPAEWRREPRIVQNELTFAHAQGWGRRRPSLGDMVLVDLPWPPGYVVQLARTPPLEGEVVVRVRPYPRLGLRLGYRSYWECALTRPMVQSTCRFRKGLRACTARFRSCSQIAGSSCCGVVEWCLRRPHKPETWVRIPPPPLGRAASFSGGPNESSPVT